MQGHRAEWRGYGREGGGDAVGRNAGWGAPFVKASCQNKVRNPYWLKERRKVREREEKMQHVTIG